MTPTELDRLLTINYLNGAVTEVLGPPGGGKTACITASANKLNIKYGGTGPADVRQRATMPEFKDTPPAFGLIVGNLSAMDVPDVAGVGIPQRDPLNKEALVMLNARPAMWPVPAIHGERGWLFLDEFRSADDSVRKPTSTLLLEGWLNGRSLPPGWQVVLASNRQSDNSGAYREFAMLNNRRCQVTFEASFADWRAWANKVGIPPIFVSFAEKHANIVFPAHPPEHDGAFCTPRSFVKAIETWVSIILDAPAAGMDANGNYRLAVNADSVTEWMPDGTKAFITESVAGWIGEAAARQLHTHVVFAREMPDLQDILDKPTEARIPQRADARYVIGHMLCAHAKDDTFAALVKYVKRLGDDICIVFVQNALQRVPALYNTKAFSEWAAANAAFAMRVIS